MGSDCFTFSIGVKQLFEDYAEDVQPKLLLAERCYRGSLPLAFSLEFRSIVTHLSRAENIVRFSNRLDDNDEKRIGEEIEKAKRHLLRVKLDCLKLICDSLEEQTLDAISHMDSVCPLRYIDDGEYVKQILATQSEARGRFEEAKIADCAGDRDVVRLYDVASSQYMNLASLVGLKFAGFNRFDRVDRFRTLERDERKAKKRGWAFFVAGVVVALVGFVLEFTW